MHKATFTTSDGSVFDVSGAFDTLMFGTDLAGWEWNSVSSGFVREKRTYSVELIAGTKEQRTRIEKLLMLADYDTERGLPDRLEVDGWYIECNITKGSVTNWYSENRVWSLDLSVSSPLWRRETSYDFIPQQGTEQEISDIDYPHDYPHDYGSSGRADTFTVDAHTPCDFRITVFGYAIKPTIHIDDNTYGVNVTVQDRGLLVIDSTKKASMAHDSVVLKDAYGNCQDVFSSRIRGAKGSGSYIFEQITPGDHTVTWDQSWGFNLAIIERRAALPWI